MEFLAKVLPAGLITQDFTLKAQHMAGDIIGDAFTIKERQEMFQIFRVMPFIFSAKFESTVSKFDLKLLHVWRFSLL